MVKKVYFNLEHTMIYPELFFAVHMQNYFLQCKLLDLLFVRPRARKDATNHASEFLLTRNREGLQKGVRVAR
jgi:hypothetical protein